MEKSKFPLVPYQLQEDAINLGIKSNMLATPETGTGKTLIATETIRRLITLEQNKPIKNQKFKSYPVLIICKYKALHQWEQFIRNQDKKAKPVIVDRTATKDEWKFLLSNNAHIITHFHTFHHAPTYRFLRDKRFFAIILDEAHTISNYKAKWSERIRYLKAYRKIAMSASLRPLTDDERKAGKIASLKSPAQLWNILAFLYPNKYRSYWKFVDDYCITKMTPFSQMPQIIGGNKNTEEELADLLRPFYISFTKKDMREDMPPLIETVVPIAMEKHQEKLYNKLVKSDDILIWPDTEEGKAGALKVLEDPIVIKSQLSIITKLWQCASHSMLIPQATKQAKELKNGGKYLWIKDYIENNPNEHIIIFTYFKAIAEVLAKEFSDIPPIMGGQKGRIYPNPAHRVVVGTIDAMADSLDFPWIDTAIFHSASRSRINMQQSAERIYRINIESPKQLYYLQSVYNDGRPTQDQVIWNGLKKGWSMSNFLYESIINLS